MVGGLAALLPGCWSWLQGADREHATAGCHRHLHHRKCPVRHQLIEQKHGGGSGGMVRCTAVVTLSTYQQHLAFEVPPCPFDLP